MCFRTMLIDLSETNAPKYKSTASLFLTQIIIVKLLMLITYKKLVSQLN